MWAPPAGPGRRARATTHECGAPPRTPPTVTPSRLANVVELAQRINTTTTCSCTRRSLLLRVLVGLPFLLLDELVDAHHRTVVSSEVRPWSRWTRRRCSRLPT